MVIEATFQMFYTESRMWENCTLRPYYATASQAGSMRVNRRETAKSVLWVAEGRACVSCGGAPLYSTPHCIQINNQTKEKGEPYVFLSVVV